MKKILLLLSIISVLNTYAQKGNYKITVKLKNSYDTALILVHYYGAKQYIDDTAYINKKGYFVFSGNKELAKGMYIVVGENKKKYFDFFLTDNNYLEFSCDPMDVVNTMKVKGSADNIAFYEYIKYLGNKQKEIDPLRNRLKQQGVSSDSLTLIKSRIKSIDNEVESYIKNYIQQSTKWLSASFIKANMEPEYMQYAKVDGVIDSSLIYKAYKAHYFDNVTFSDARLIYTPILSQKIDYYFDKLVVPVLDSIQKEIDYVFELSSVNSDMQKYVAWYLLLKFETSKIMGYDALFVYITRNYLENNKIGWMYPEVKNNILNKTNTLEPLLLGKKASNLILIDTANTPQSLYGIKSKYTILFFWESNCGHCQQEMVKVLDFYAKYHQKYNLEIYGVSTDTSWVKMKSYISKNKIPWINVNGHYSVSGNYRQLYDVKSTPIMFLLDEQKKFLTKLLLIEDIQKFIENREKMLNIK